MSTAVIIESLGGIVEAFAARLLLEDVEAMERVAGSHWRTAARVVWAMLILLSLGLFVISLPLRYHQLRDFSFAPLPRSDILRAVDPQPLRAALAELGLSTTFFAWYSLALEIVFAATFCGVAALIVTRRTKSWWTMFVVLMLVVFGTSSLPTITALAGTHPVLDLLARVTHMLGWALIEIFLLLFPTGRFVPRWTSLAALGYLGWSLLMALFPDSIVSPFAWPDQLAFLLWTVVYAGGMAAQVYRYRHYANHVERLQTKWTLLSVVIAVVGTLAVNVPTTFAPGLTTHGTGAICELIRIPAGALFILVMPVTVGIAILRYRLWEIDLLISRTLVYLPLTAILGGLYTASISLFQRLFVATTGNTSDVAIVLTTLVVASAFTPVKNGLQATVDRRFKPASSRHNDLHAYRQQLQSIVSVLDMRQAMRRLLETAVSTLAARGGAIYLLVDGQLELAQTIGNWDGAMTIRVPLEWGETELGLVALGPRQHGQRYTESDLEELRQAATNLAHLAALENSYAEQTAQDHPQLTALTA